MDMESHKCKCGKRRDNMNCTNWSRHLVSCKKNKLSYLTPSISSFFKKLRPTTDAEHADLTDIIIKESENSAQASSNILLVGQPNNDAELECVNTDNFNSESSSNNVTLVPSEQVDLTDIIKETESNTQASSNSNILLVGQPNNNTELQYVNMNNFSSVSSSNSVTLLPSAYKELNELGNDPAILSQIENLDPGLISYFLKMGAAQQLPSELPEKLYPRDHNGRSFHESWYWNKRSTGEVSQRKWLSYSLKNNKIYCLYCSLFARNGKQNWIKSGFSNWNKGTVSIIMHETSETHIMASLKVAYKQAEYPLIPLMKESANANIAF